VAEDAASLLALLRRTMDPDGYITPMLDDPDSSATLQALVAQFARLGRAVDYNSKLALISLAPGGSPGTCMATVTRAVSGTAGTIPKGYAFVDARNVQYVSVTDVTVHSGDVSVSVPLTTLRQTEAVNSEDDPDVSLAAVNAVVLDGTDTTALIAPPGDPSVVTTTFQVVAETTQVLGGATDYLSVLGAERGCFRQPGESTDGYRARVRNIPDVVSPLAIAAAVTAAASKAGGGAVVLEPFNDGADPAIKEAADLSNFNLQTFDLDYMDDTGTPPDIERYSLREVAAYFRIDLVGVLADAGGIVKFYDASYHDDPLLGFRDVPLPAAVAAAGAAVWVEANAKRAGGVQFDVFEPVILRSTVRGSANGAAAVVATLTPPSGDSWIFSEALVSHDVASASRSEHWLVFTFSDSTTYTTARFDKSWSQRISFAAFVEEVGLSKPIVQIDLWTRAADDSTPTNAVLAVWYVQLDAYP
jgi:hypothetical protein